MDLEAQGARLQFSHELLLNLVPTSVHGSEVSLQVKVEC